MHSILPTHLGRTLFYLLDVSERNFFSQIGGGGVHVYAQYYRELSFYDLVLTSMQLDFYN